MIKHSLTTLAAALLLAGLPLAATAETPPARPPVTAHQSFATPEAAADALVAAVRSADPLALLAVVGPKASDWLFTDDPVADREEWSRFLAAYDEAHTLLAAGKSRYFLQVGQAGWSFPAPIVRKSAGWRFDAAAGREEILNRRIGRNELDTLQTLLAVVDAQREYAAADPDGNGFHDYARQFISGEGRRDGLYWPVAEGETPSPLGPAIGAAARQGYQIKAGTPTPGGYHGYRFRILEGQGRHAPGGRYSYLVDERLIGGFAVLAYPAEYGVSGVMSFMVSHDGKIYQRDLGAKTAQRVAAMSVYNPGPGWQPVPEAQPAAKPATP